MTAALCISSLRKTFSQGRVAVDDLSLVVEPGEFCGLLGPNGAGKSTTIRCVTGVATPSGGTIRVLGVDVVKDYSRARRLVGCCPQDSRVDPFATPLQIVDWMGGYFGMRAAARRRRIAELFDRFGLQAHAKTAYYQLSGGLRRRVIICRALVHDPDLLILDEPTAGVDVELRHDIWSYLSEANRQGKTILFISHYLEEMERLCRTLAIIHKGTIIRRGPMHEFARDGLEATYLGLIRSEANIGRVAS